MYGNGAITECMCVKWHAKFGFGNFNANNVPAPIIQLILHDEVYPYQSLPEIRDSLQRRQENSPFLKRIVTGDGLTLMGV